MVFLSIGWFARGVSIIGDYDSVCSGYIHEGIFNTNIRPISNIRAHFSNIRQTIRAHFQNCELRNIARLLKNISHALVLILSNQGGAHFPDNNKLSKSY